MSHPCEAFPLCVYRVTFSIRSPSRIAQEPLLKVRTGGFQYFDAKGAPVPGNETAALVEKTTTARWDGMRWFRLYELTTGKNAFRFPAPGSFATEYWRGEWEQMFCVHVCTTAMLLCLITAGFHVEYSMHEGQLLQHFFASGFLYFFHCSLKCHPFLFTGEMDWTLLSKPAPCDCPGELCRPHGCFSETDRDGKKGMTTVSILNLFWL